MARITLDNLMEVVQQPEYSLSKLLEFEQKYKISTIEFLNTDMEVLEMIMPDRDISKWCFHAELFSKYN